MAAVTVAMGSAMGSPAQAFGVDGILGAGDVYTSTFTIVYNVTGGTPDPFTDTGTLLIGTGSDLNSDSVSDYRVAVTVPLSIVDNTYGVNQDATWGSLSHPYTKLLKSDKLEFKLIPSGGGGGSDVKIDYIHDDNLARIEGGKDGGGAIIDIASSLEYNLDPSAHASFSDPTAVPCASAASPGCNSTPEIDYKKDSPPSVEAALFADFEPQVIYEFAVDGATFTSGFGLANISMAVLHASNNKQDGNNAVPIPCTDPGTALCVEVVVDPPTTGVPEPASLALLGSGLFGVAFVRRRRRRAA